MLHRTNPYDRLGETLSSLHEKHKKHLEGPWASPYLEAYLEELRERPDEDRSSRAERLVLDSLISSADLANTTHGLGIDAELKKARDAFEVVRNYG